MIGQVSETDLAQPIVWAPKIRMLGQVSEIDLAQPITAVVPVIQLPQTNYYGRGGRPPLSYDDVSKAWETAEALQEWQRRPPLDDGPAPADRKPERARKPAPSPQLEEHAGEVAPGHARVDIDAAIARSKGVARVDAPARTDAEITGWTEAELEMVMVAVAVLAADD